jgi:glycosyltransferase involved in cell wall biosynthesis
MRIAIVHDYLIDFGGAERVLLALHEIYPEAPIYVSIYRPSCLGKFAEKFKNVKIIQSNFGKLPFADRLISPLRFLIPGIWKNLNLKSYDLILSSASWAVTKGFEKKVGAIEICYCHTPPRYLYGFDTSRKFGGLMGKLVGFYGQIVNGFMRKYDFNRAQNVDYFIANSEEVKKRIEKFYRRDSIVIYPPIDIDKYPDMSYLRHLRSVPNRDYYLTGGRLTAAKNFDLIIKTFNKLGLPLKVYGSGPQEFYLKSIAKKNVDSTGSPQVEFLGRVDDSEMGKLYSNAKAFVLAQKDEDFGMTSIESMSFGTPLISYHGGGYVESVLENKTGVFFNELTVESLAKVIKNFDDSNHRSITAENCMNQAKKFSKEVFITKIKNFVNSKI